MSSYAEREQIATKLFFYYKKLFPFELLYRWLNYGNGALYFRRREFSYTVLKGSFVRYQSYENLSQWWKAVLKERPAKIDIGAVYTFSAKEKHNPQFAPCEKELVFDIDITDYADVRNCCREYVTSLCVKCWKFMALACKILDVALREDFGFQNILWVFSGRRGIHCWVCDNSVRKMTIEARNAIVDYLQLIKGGSYMPKKVKIEGNIHHSIRRALNILNENFETICIEEQDILGTPRRLNLFIEALGDDLVFKENVRKRLLMFRTSKDRWTAFVNYIQELKNTETLEIDNWNVVEEIVIQYLYMRLDTAVSNSVNHLLKCPFSVHPETGKISVPFSSKDVDNFDPLNAPTVRLLLREIELNGNAGASSQVQRDYKNTSLCSSIVIFEEFVNGLEQSSGGEKLTVPLKPLRSYY